MAFQVRRVITGHNANGKAVVKIDKPVTVPLAAFKLVGYSAEQIAALRRSGAIA